MKSAVVVVIWMLISRMALCQEGAGFSKAETKWLSKNEVNAEVLTQLNAREDSLFQEALALFQKSHRLGFASLNEFVAAPAAVLIGASIMAVGEGIYFYSVVGTTIIGAGIVCIPVAWITFMVSRTKLRASNQQLQILKSTYENRQLTLALDQE